MEIIRRLTLWILASLLFMSLLFVAYGWTFNQTIARSETIKSWLDQSGAYDSIVTEIIAASQNSDGGSTSTIDQETLTKAANNSFTPDRLRLAAESVLDGVYGWLNESEGSISFEINLTEAKNDFAAQLRQAAETRIENLPLCGSANTPREFDPFGATCRVPANETDRLLNTFEDEIASEESFLSDSVITADDISGDQPLETQLSWLRPVFRVVKFSYIIATGIALLSLWLLYLLARDRRKLWRRIIRGLFGVALSLGIFTFLSARSSDWIEKALQSEEANGFVSNVMQPIINIATDDVTYWTFRFTVFYAALALLLLVLYLRTRHAEHALHGEPPALLEKKYEKAVKKKPRKYNKTNPKHKEAVKKKVLKKTKTRPKS